MNCIYIKNGKPITEVELIKKYLESSSILKNSAIYSEENVRDNVYNTLAKFNDLKSYQSDEYIKIREFIESPLTKELKEILKLSDIRSLVPEYIEENYITNYIIENYNRLINYDTVKGDFEYESELSKLLSDRELLDDIGVEELDRDKVKFLLNEVKKEIEFNELVFPINNFLHNVISDVISSNKDPRGIYEQHFSKLKSEEGDKLKTIFGEDIFDEDKPLYQNWRMKILDIVFKIEEKVRNSGSPLTSLKVVSGKDDPTTVKLAGNIDIVTVNLNGDLNIYSIKLAKTPFSNWVNAKKLTSDWELALQRQILGQVVPIDGANLHVIPLILSTFGNPGSLHLDVFQNRTAAGESGLIDNLGQIAIRAEKILKRKLIVPLDLERVEILKNKLNILLPEYEIRTEFEDNNVDLIVENAEKRFRETRDAFRKFNDFDNIDGLEKGWIEVKPENNTQEAITKAREEFRKKIEKYVNFVKSQESRGVSVMMNAIRSAMNNTEKIKTSKYKSKRDTKVNHVLNEFLSKDWEVLDIKEASPLGIIVIRNKVTGVTNLFNVSINQFYADSGIDDFNFGELDTIKAMSFLDNFKNELFPNEVFKFGQIITFNPKNGDSFYKSGIEALRIYKERMSRIGQVENINLDETNIVSVEDQTLSDVKAALKNYSGKDSEKIQVIYDIIGEGDLNEIDIRRLKEALKVFLDYFSSYKHKVVKPELNFDDPLEVIYSLLQVAILTKSGFELVGDFKGMTKYSLLAGDFRSLISSLYTSKQTHYDKSARRIQGLFGGLAWTSPDWVQSKDLRQLNGLILTANSITGDRMIESSDVIRPHTKKYFESIGYGAIERLSIGESQSKFKNLFLTDNDGKVSIEFKTKNPYVENVENALLPHESEYLKNILFIINKHKYRISEKDANKVNTNDINSIKSIDVLRDAIESGEYFEMPLIRNREYSKYGGDIKNMPNKIVDNFKAMLDPRELSQFDLNNIEADTSDFFEMYDIYRHQTGNTRAKMLERGVNYYDVNLDTIAHLVAYNGIRKNVFDMVLPTINAYMWGIKLIGARQNIDVSKQLEYVINQIKLAIFNEPLVTDEQKNLATTISTIRTWSTFFMLAFRPTLLAKELSIGLMKNINMAVTGLNKEVGLKEMRQAYIKLLTIDNQFTDEYNIIQTLNHSYRMANMDISTLPHRLKTDKWGAAKGLNTYAYQTSTLGDYYNRMAILISKMLRDGSYDAHKLVGDVLHYDPTMDKRFSYYFKVRDAYKNDKGEYTSSNSDEKYNTQRRRYLYTIDQINKENAVIEGVKLTEKDLIPKAYTQQERNSIKSQTDLIFGAYDKDWQPPIGHTLYGIAFMQFMQYWPNKMRLWFGKEVKGDESMIGQVEQYYTIDENNNKQLWYWELKEENGVIQERMTTSNTGDPVLHFNGSPQEGIAITFLSIIRDISTGNWKKIKNDEHRKIRALYGLNDAAIMFIILGIMSQIFKALREEQEDGSLSVELIKFMEDVNLKVLNEANVWQNTFGAIRTEPTVLSWGERIIGNMSDVAKGNKSLIEAGSRTIGALNFLYR